MKRIVLWLLSVLIVFTGCSAEEKGYDPVAALEFPKLNWGLSMEQVSEVYPLTEDSRTDQTVSCIAAADVYGEKADVIFGFARIGEKTYLMTAQITFSEMEEKDQLELLERLDTSFSEFEQGEKDTVDRLSDEQRALYEQNCKRIGYDNSHSCELIRLTRYDLQIDMVAVDYVCANVVMK